MIIIHRSKNRQFYFTVTAINGQILATSETYTRKRNCEKGITSLINQLNQIQTIVDKTK